MKDINHYLQAHSYLMQNDIVKVDNMKETILEFKKMLNSRTKIIIQKQGYERSNSEFEILNRRNFLDIHFIHDIHAFYHMIFLPKNENPMRWNCQCNSGKTKTANKQWTSAIMPGKKDNAGPKQVSLKTEQAQKKC